MLAFKITVNGEVVHVAGQEDSSILTSHVTASLEDSSPRGVAEYIHLTSSGLSTENSEGISQHFRWPIQNLKIGDTVQFEIIETDSVTPPKKRYRNDAEVQESPFTEEEAKEMRHQDYLQLKKEFEGSSDA